MPEVWIKVPSLSVHPRVRVTEISCKTVRELPVITPQIELTEQETGGDQTSNIAINPPEAPTHSANHKP